MLTEQLLLNQQELLDELDTEPIFDYLLQHGVMDTSTANTICGDKTPQERNIALLQHLEIMGKNAVDLFINALRQSGQLRLASTLDVSQRIRPISGSGYWEKQRHKGQVLVKVQVKAICVLTETAHKQNGQIMGEIYDVKMTPRRLHKSYDNMLILDNDETVSTKPKRIIEYPYICDDVEDEDVIKPKKSCWCMCFPIFRSKRKNKEKYAEKAKSKSPSKQSQSLQVKSRSRYNSPSKGNNSIMSNSGDISSNGYSRTTSPLKGNKNDYKNGVKGHKHDQFQKYDCKENMDPISMRYNQEFELVEMKRFSHKDRSRYNRHSKPQMCEVWMSEGKEYEDKACEFYSVFENELKNSCIKYFEQNRGTLILQIFCDDKGIDVFNICMSKEHVEKLHQEYENGSLERHLQELLANNGTMKRLDIRDMKLSVNIESEQFSSALQELT